MYRPRFTFVWLMGLLVCASAYAQPQSLGARIAKLAAPLGADAAIAIVRIDTKKLDFEAAVDWAAKAMQASDKERLQMEQTLKEPREFIKSFRAAGGQELIWLIFPTPAPGPGGPPVEVAGVATSAAGKSAEVAAFLKQVIPAEQLEVISQGDTVVIASADRMKSLDKAAKPSPIVIKGFDTAGEGTVQAVVLLSGDARRVVSETLPRLPEKFGGVSGKELSDAFSWAALSIDAPPKLKVKLQVQATSAEGAQSLARVASHWPKLAGSQEQVRQSIPGFDKLLPLLTPKAVGDKVVLSIGEKPGEVDQLLPAILVPLKASREAAARSQHMNSLRQIGLAMHNFLDTHKHFPAQALRSKDGKPLLSWRVQVLPYLEQGDLYKQFHLDEPWDSEHNKTLIEKMPKLYEDPRVADLPKGKTTFLVPVGETTIFGGKEGMKLQKITDGTSNTILAVESDAKRAVIWTKPDDLQTNLKDPAEGLFSDGRKQILALFADGSVHVLQLPQITEKLPALFSANGGEAVDF